MLSLNDVTGKLQIINKMIDDEIFIAIGEGLAGGKYL